LIDSKERPQEYISKLQDLLKVMFNRFALDELNWTVLFRLADLPRTMDKFARTLAQSVNKHIRLTGKPTDHKGRTPSTAAARHGLHRLAAVLKDFEPNPTTRDKDDKGKGK
jgi:hypothetical protein